MGTIVFRRAGLIGAAGDTVGYKAGVVLTRDELIAHTRDLEIESWWTGDVDEEIRVRSEEFQEAIERLLYAVGNIPTPQVLHPAVALINRYKGDSSKFKVVEQVLDRFKLRHEKGEPHLSAFLHQSRELGSDGESIAQELLEAVELFIHANPWSRVRRVNWKDSAELRGLFESASLDTQYGTFFDQRYIDYLARNFDAIDKIHWRKFEGLTAEFFNKEGWKVEIGPGQGDDGVDVRVWPRDADVNAAPAILIQFKRQKETVGKVIVKSLYADVLHEKAESGIIVTTSRLATGAQQTSSARMYPVRQADRKQLRQWIERLRTPGTGVFLSE